MVTQEALEQKQFLFGLVKQVQPPPQVHSPKVKQTSAELGGGE